MQRAQHGPLKGHLKQIQKVKELSVGGGASWASQNLYWTVVLSCWPYAVKQQGSQPLSEVSMPQKANGMQHLVATSSVFGLRRISKGLSIAELVPQGSWPLSGSQFYYSFLNISEAVTPGEYVHQIDDVHWKMQCLELASVNKSARFFSRSMSSHTSQTNTSEVGQIGLWNPPSFTIFTWPLAYWLLHLQTSWPFFYRKHACMTCRI